MLIAWLPYPPGALIQVLYWYLEVTAESRNHFVSYEGLNDEIPINPLVFGEGGNWTGAGGRAERAVKGRKMWLRSELQRGWRLGVSGSSNTDQQNTETGGILADGKD